MKKIFLTTLAALWGLCPAGVFAVNPIHPVGAHRPVSDANRAENCDLAAPDHFKVTDITPTSISLGWDSVHAAVAYRVQVFESGTGNLVTEATVPNTGVQLAVPAGMQFDISVAAIAPDCPPSRNLAWLLKIGVIIVDLIAEQQGANESQMELVQPSGEGCYDVPWIEGAYWFDVYRHVPADYNRYKVCLTNTSSIPQPGNCPPDDDLLIHKESTGGANYVAGFWTIPAGLTNNNWSWPPACNATMVRIKELGNGLEIKDLYNVYLLNSETGLQVCFVALFPKGAKYGIRLWKISGSNQGDPGSGNSNANATGTKPARYSPEQGSPDIFVTSPFLDQIQISFPQSDAEYRSTLFLYDRQGQLLQRSTVTATGQYFLPAADLPPGLYFLGAETNGRYRCFKVVKR